MIEVGWARAQRKRGAIFEAGVGLSGRAFSCTLMRGVDSERSFEAMARRRWGARVGPRREESGSRGGLACKSGVVPRCPVRSAALLEGEGGWMQMLCSTRDEASLALAGPKPQNA